LEEIASPNNEEMKATETLQYQSTNESYESIVKNFIVRRQEFDRVMDDIRHTERDSSFQHYVFIGKRGSGKSTLLRRIQAEIHLNESLCSQYDVVKLGEEQSFIYRLYDLWDYVIRELNTMGYHIDSLDFRSYKDNMKDYTKALHRQIIEALRQRNKSLILLLDNIDRILDSRSGNSDAAVFRELLINFKEIRIIGASTYMSEHFWKYDMPFYQFFSIKTLEKLSLEEVELLLTHWSKVKGIPEMASMSKEQPGKIQSIRMLTDGMPRTMLLFVDMLIHRPEQNGYEYLKQLVDKATPIYQERLGSLSNAQKKVLSELAFLWDAASVEELVPLCNMEGKLISALLNQLVEIKYVEKIKTHTKNNLYRVEERFFNLWFNITQGGINSRIKAKALTEFLEKWYESEGLNDLFLGFNSSAESEVSSFDFLGYPPELLVANQGRESYPEDGSILKTEKKIVKQNFDATINELSTIRNIIQVYEAGDHGKALTLLNESEKATASGNINYEYLRNFVKSKKYYLKAVDHGDFRAFIYFSKIFYIENRKTELKELIASQSPEVLEKLVENHNDFACIIFLYLGDFDRFQSISNQYMSENMIPSAILLEQLLVLKQKNWVYKYFTTHTEMIEEYKPLYYALLHLLDDKKQEILKMPPEIKQTVEDIILKIRGMQEHYGV
jgi:hypothetical protein